MISPKKIFYQNPFGAKIHKETGDEYRNIKSIDTGANTLSMPDSGHPCRRPAIDSPVIYGVRAETSNPYHLVCIERYCHIQLLFFQIIEYQPNA
jgi:hypothetical protein